MTSAAKAERRKHGYRGVLATCVAGLLIFAIAAHQILIAALIGLSSSPCWCWSCA